MKLRSDIPIAVELSDPEIREHTVASQIKIGIPFQLRAMREVRGWTQETVAGKIGTTQNTISRLENPKTGKPTIKTLLRLAKVFDVGLLVRFVPFGFYGDVINAMDATHVGVPSYDEELRNEETLEHANDEPVLKLLPCEKDPVLAEDRLAALEPQGVGATSSAAISHNDLSPGSVLFLTDEGVQHGDNLIRPTREEWQARNGADLVRRKPPTPISALSAMQAAQ